MIYSDEIKYVIVQAGGKGTRLGKYSNNRPKCLLPVNGIPMIINTLNKYQDKHVIIIGDHLFDVLKTYVDEFYNVKNYSFIFTEEKGTCAGLNDAVRKIPEDQPFILTWSDLFFEKEQKFSFDSELLVGISNTFKCRWKYDKKFINEPSTDCGVSGFFVFKDKSRFDKLTTEKSLVRGFLSDHYCPDEISAFFNHDCFEVGEKEHYEKLLAEGPNHRYFNKVDVIDDIVYKRCVDSKYDSVHENEKDWYESVGRKYNRIPKIYSTNPLIMEKINGKHLWEVDQRKGEIIENYCNALDSLHNIDAVDANIGECMQVYFSKAYKRVAEVANIIPYVNRPYININGKDCQNPIYDLSYFEDLVSSICNIEKYNVIHGDCTFSNTLVDNNCKIWMIDPRGTFGSTQIYGDKRYDWAKFYYSASGNYDSINSKKFEVTISGDKVNLEIESNGYEDYKNVILNRSGMTKREMELIHSTLWLSLTGYVKEDIEAVMYAFYRGCELWSIAK